MAKQLLWGIDLGGTKIEGVVVAVDAPSLALARVRLPTEQNQGYAHILTRVAQVVRELGEQTNSRPTLIGCGTPGALDKLTGVMKNCNTSCLNGMPLARDLEQELRVPVRLANDANCFTLAEATFGAGKDARVVFGVIMGTGVGGGIVIDKHVLTGHQQIAGEWGHNVLDPDGALCYCGKRGCVETVISGPALEAFFAKLSGASLPLAEIASRVPSDSAARETMERLCSSFARAISVVINILDPDLVVLGGGVSNFSALYDTALPRVVDSVFNLRLDTPIVRNALGDSAGVFGAALLCGG